MNEFWQGEKALRFITPPGERFPEGDIHGILNNHCEGKVLEYGCGDGRLAPAFEVENYIGVDINPSAVEKAKRNNPEYDFRPVEFPGADTILAHTVLLHVSDDRIEQLIGKFLEYPRIVIGEVMGRNWRRSGNPPVYNRDEQDYIDMMGRPVDIFHYPYPRYKCDFTILVC